MKSDKNTHGICALTKTYGKYVKCHIVPEALSVRGGSAGPVIQRGKGNRPSRHWTSWYDNQLVTQAGEELLSKIDTAGISELRKHGLIWSSWGPMQVLGSRHQQFPLTGHGFRQISGVDGDALRLFLLSVFWRAAVSDRPEFVEINVPEQDQEKIRKLLVERQAGDSTFYPIRLAQLSSLGWQHNQSPFVTLETYPGIEDLPTMSLRTFRFYFDGLIVKVILDALNLDEVPDGGEINVGFNDKLFVPTIPYEISFQRENLKRVLHGNLKRIAIQTSRDKDADNPDLSVFHRPWLRLWP